MEKENNLPLPLHEVHLDRSTSIINRTHILIHSFLISIFLYHRISQLSLFLTHPINPSLPSTSPPFLACLLLFGAELLLSISWLFEQAFRWRPVKRTVFIDRLPEESKLPAVDVFICTADPDKEPTFEVMNTVVSAMTLDYSSDKLNVYLSDDGGAAVTLAAVKEAWGFATWWVPFCRRYGVNRTCPITYFETQDETFQTIEESSSEFIKERLQLKEKYEEFKERVMKLGQEKGGHKQSKSTKHPATVQVINEKNVHHSIINPHYTNIPMLVYVARERKPSYRHNFKAGALNVLLRVSGILTNSPIILVLDCDMFCDDPTSAKQAMCFYVDEKISPLLAFVQFPQMFRNVSKSDIYDTDLRLAFKVLTRGMDGLSTGTLLCGTGFYMKRKALYNITGVKDLNIIELRTTHGPSNEFIKTLSPKLTNESGISIEMIEEAKFLASSSYEEDTKWGKGVGFYYYSVVEDVFTGYNLHSNGWKSIFLDPERPAFLGTTTTNLNDVLIQNTRWSAGLVEVALSRYCPFIYGSLRRRSLLACICYAWADFFPLAFISIWCLAIIPQLFLFHGSGIYPTVPSLNSSTLALIFLSSLLKHLYEVLTTGGTVVSWLNEQRMWMVKMLTCNTYGSIDGIMKILRLKNTSFTPTNKFIDNEREKRYHQGIYDFQTSSMFLIPLGTVVILNLFCFVGGLARLMIIGNWGEMAAQVMLSFFFLVISLPVIEGMIVRKDAGRFPTFSTLMSVATCLVVMVFGSFIFFY